MIIEPMVLILFNFSKVLIPSENFPVAVVRIIIGIDEPIPNKNIEKAPIKIAFEEESA